MSLRAPSSCVFFLILAALFSSTFTNAFNITKILSNSSDFSSFNNLLTQSGVAETINSRSTITVLALDNAAVAALQGKAKDEVQRILMNHVVLDYYDLNKLKKLTNKTAALTTLFQASGSAQPGQGFLNATLSSSGDVMFGSEVKNAPLVARAVKSVYSEPYNISVIQISQGIVAPGIDAPAPFAHTVPPAPSPTTYKAPPPAPSSDEEDSGSTETAPNPGPADSGVHLALGRGTPVAVLMGLALNFVGF